MYRAHACLAVGILELFIKLGDIERAHIDRFCLGYYLQLYMVHYQLSGYGIYHCVNTRKHLADKLVNEQKHEKK